MCNCNICITHDKLRWATILECQCHCHESDKIAGHDSLCCSYPNGKKKDNPHTILVNASVYRKELDSLTHEEE